MFSSLKRAAMPQPQPEPQPEPPSAEQISEFLTQKNRTLNALRALQQQAEDRRSQVEQLAGQAAAIEQTYSQLQEQIATEQAKIAELDSQITDDRKRLEAEIDRDLKTMAAKADRINSLREELAALVTQFSEDAVNIRGKQRQLFSPQPPDSIPTIVNLESPYAHRGLPVEQWKGDLPSAKVDLKRQLATLRTISAQQSIDRNHEEQRRRSSGL